jgi:hypothetical protein
MGREPRMPTKPLQQDACLQPMKLLDLEQWPIMAFEPQLIVIWDQKWRLPIFNPEHLATTNLQI